MELNTEIWLLTKTNFVMLFCGSCRWGLSRHFHYVPEILSAFFWTVPALFNHVSSVCVFFFPLFLCVTHSFIVFCSSYLSSMWYFLLSFFLTEQKGMMIDVGPSKQIQISVLSLLFSVLNMQSCTKNRLARTF